MTGNYSKFKKEYEVARDAGHSEFVFNGQGIITAYAKYLCEYMEGLSQEARDKVFIGSNKVSDLGTNNERGDR